MTNLLRAPLMILLSDVEGVYDRNPAEPGAQLMSVITHLDAADSFAKDSVGPARIQLSRGGMGSKLRAARIAAAAASERRHRRRPSPNVLLDILAGAEVGTLILAEGRTVASRKRWIGWSATPRGKTPPRRRRREGGAVERQEPAAVGVRGVEGNFAKGDVVRSATPPAPSSPAACRTIPPPKDHDRRPTQPTASPNSSATAPTTKRSTATIWWC